MLEFKGCLVNEIVRLSNLKKSHAQLTLAKPRRTVLFGMILAKPATLLSEISYNNSPGLSRAPCAHTLLSQHTKAL